MMNYKSWVDEVPEKLKTDLIWKFPAYSKALLLFDLVWEDCDRLKDDIRGKALIKEQRLD